MYFLAATRKLWEWSEDFEAKLYGTRPRMMPPVVVPMYSSRSA